MSSTFRLPHYPIRSGTGCGGGCLWRAAGKRATERKVWAGCWMERAGGQRRQRGLRCTFHSLSLERETYNVSMMLLSSSSNNILTTCLLLSACLAIPSNPAQAVEEVACGRRRAEGRGRDVEGSGQAGRGGRAGCSKIFTLQCLNVIRFFVLTNLVVLFST